MDAQKISSWSADRRTFIVWWGLKGDLLSAHLKEHPNFRQVRQAVRAATLLSVSNKRPMQHVSSTYKINI